MILAIVLTLYHETPDFFTADHVEKQHIDRKKKLNSLQRIL